MIGPDGPWIKVGAATIESADAVQDVGLIVTSHSFGNLCTVTFDDFYLADEADTPIGEDIEVSEAEAGVVMTFDTVETLGATTVVTTQQGPEPPTGFQLAEELPTYYEITTTAVFSGFIEVRIEYNDSGMTVAQEQALRLFHFEDTDTPPDGTPDAWVDRTLSVDIENNIISAKVSSLSPFAVFELANQAPMAQDDDVNTDEDASLLINVLANNGNGPDIDADGNLDPTSVTITNGPSHGSTSVNSITGEVTYTPSPDFNGTDSFVYEVGDTEGLYDTAIVTITVYAVNDEPVLNAIGNQSINELTALTFTATAADVDLPPDALTFTLDPGAMALGMSISADGNFTWTPTETQGGASYEVTITVTDNGTPNLADSKTIYITVNDTPTTTGIGDIEVAEDAPDTVVDLFTAFDDVEDDDGDLIYEIQSISNPTLFTSVTIDEEAGTLTLDYAPDTNGTAEITVLVTDTGGLTVEAVFTVRVLSATEQIDRIIDDIEVLNDTGVLTNGQANPPLNFLDQAIKDLDKGKTVKAISKLNDVIDRIQDLIDDETLSPELGLPLIDMVYAAITAALPG
jgi:hypothetical protein